jgi:hypothetical protein
MTNRRRTAAHAAVLTLAAMLTIAGCGESASPPPPPASAPAAPPAPAPTATPKPTPPPPPPAPPKPPKPAAKKITIYLTGYSWQDNTPPGSSVVSMPVVHHVAGGTGTFADPITVAVPGYQGKSAWGAGTKFYLPTVRRYVIVEDTGASPAPPGASTHLDMWIGGQGSTRSATDDCESDLTGKVPAILNPDGNLPVLVGPIFSGGGCRIP